MPSVNIVASLVRAHLDSNPTIEKLDYSKVNIQGHPNMAAFRTNQSESPLVVIILRIHLKFYFPVPRERWKPEGEGGRQ